MPLALGTAAIVLVALLCEVTRPRLTGALARLRSHRSARARANAEIDYDPGRERRAEQRARALLRSCIADEDWAMYRDLGFLRVWGGLGGHGRGQAPALPADRIAAGSGDELGPATGGQGDGHAGAGAGAAAGGEGTAGAGTGDAPYAYLIYPHRPIVAYLPQTRTLLNEYCVAFPDHSMPYGSARLPDSDDVLAKWMALTGDERGLIADANMHLPGRQIDPDMVRRDLLRLSRWERARIGRRADNVRAA
jgi:hypothetical protein